MSLCAIIPRLEPVDEHIVFDSTLYVPPLGTANRRIDGELGNFRLDMGGGYLLHGTASGETPRSAITHGCVRVGDDDLQWRQVRVRRVRDLQIKALRRVGLDENKLIPACVGVAGKAAGFPGVLQLRGNVRGRKH